MKEGGWARGRSEQGESRRRWRRGAAHPGRWERRPIQSPAVAAQPQERKLEGGKLFQADELSLPQRSSVI